jgi:putative peptidoglycan lipid II flippase
MVPGTLGVAAVNINLLVNTWLATNEPEGAVSWLGYAFRLMYLPIGLFGVSIATAALPEISRHAVADDIGSIRSTVSGALRMMLMLNVPAMAGLMVLADPIVALLYQRGMFEARDTAATAAALICYAPGLLGYSIVKIASPTFYSLKDSRTPAIVSVTSVAMNLVLNLVLVRYYGFRGLALGTAIAALFNAAVLLWLLRGRLDGLDGRRLFVAVAKIVPASAVMAVVAVLVSRWFGDAYPGAGELMKAMRVAVSIAAAVVALAISARLLRIDEFDQAVARIMRRIAPARR